MMRTTLEQRQAGHSCIWKHTDRGQWTASWTASWCRLGLAVDCGAMAARSNVEALHGRRCLLMAERMGIRGIRTYSHRSVCRSFRSSLFRWKKDSTTLMNFVASSDITPAARALKWKH